MAYDRDEIFQQAQAAIRDHNLFFIEDVVAFLPVSKQTFYRFFPIECDEYDALKRMCGDNKIKTKSGIRAKLYKEKGSSLIALYKMICTEEERRALSLTYQENKQEITGQVVIVTADEREKAALKKMSDEG
jgi:hypothetical protein